MIDGSGALLVYAGVAIAAAIEGEVAYVAAAALVATGHLSPAWVLLAGTVGAAAGDQAFFYLFYGRLARWTARFPSLERSAVPLVTLVRRRTTMAVLLVRFAPGVRVALTAACAYAEVSPLRFSILNTIAAFVWAVVVLVLVGWFGPASLSRFGLGGWKGALILGMAVVVLFRLLGRFERRSMGMDRL
jgi:membrane protein DedA with SNARE-associated domain